MPKKQKGSVTQTKRRRVFRQGAVRGTARLEAKIAKPKKSEDVREQEHLETAVRSVRASLRKLKEEEEAAKAFEERLASQGESRRLALQGLRRATKQNILANIVETIDENENENNNSEALEMLRVERLARAKSALNTAKAQRAAKKRNETRRKGEKKFKLDPINANALYQVKYDALIAAGESVRNAEKQAIFYRNTKTDPLFRALNTGISAWGDLALEAEPMQKAIVKKKPIALTIALEEAMTAPLRTRSYASVLGTRKADYKQLALIGLPNSTGKGAFDIRDMKRQVYGKMSGKEIFPELTKATTPIEHIYVSAKTDIHGILVVSAFVTYKTHELAKRALQYHRSKPILFKYYEGSKEIMRPPMIDQARKEDEKRSFVARE